MASISPTSPASNVGLTHDTLLHVISVSLYTSEAVKLMATCRFLYHEGAKVALKKPVVLRNAEQLTSFLKFLLAEDLSRCKYLRRLELWGHYPHLEAGLVQELTQTLPLLNCIEYLRLYRAEDFLGPHPALLPAFAALTSLRHIEILGAGGVTCQLLSALQAPLITASLDFLGDSDDRIFDHLDFEEWGKYHPTVLLTNFAPALEELQCAAWHTTPETIFPEHVYPNLRKLSIELHDLPLRMDPFIRAFPNLTDLRVRAEYHGGDLAHADQEGIRENHEINIIVQERSGTWRHLEHFSGCLLDLYSIGLTCPISRVTIVDHLNDGRCTDMLATVLRAARPVHLKLEGITGSMLGDSERGFISMLQDESMSGLLNIDVHVYFAESDRDRDLRAVIEELMSALIRLPLKFLELKFDTQMLDPTPEEDIIEVLMNQQNSLPLPRAPTPAPLSRAELSLKALSADMDALMARLESVPSLEAAHVVLPGSRQDDEDCTRTITKGTGRLLGDEQWDDWLPGKNQSVWDVARQN